MTTTFTKHQASGIELCRPIAQPHVETFAECFTDSASRDVSKPGAPHPFRDQYLVGQNIAGNLWNDCMAIMQGKGKRKHADESMRVSPFLTHRTQGGDYRFMSVQCADWVLSRIREGTIIIGGDVISFELIDHDNGWSLLAAHHSQIIGSVWLAYIQTNTIPNHAKS